MKGEHSSEDQTTREVIRGQLCDYCNPGISQQDHRPVYATDGTERWWQSPPLSRGMHLNQVNLSIHLGQEFHVAYVFIRMANSPRPGVWVLERSTDFGKTWQAWQFFADTPSDCLKFFETTAEESLYYDDQALCTTEFSKVVPLEGGEYYYSIKDISIGGRCVCNGHAETCDRPPEVHGYKLICSCVHNTCGDQCEECCPGFVQKRWRRARVNDPFVCEPCECDLRVSTGECEEGSGRCLCRQEYAGLNCDRCNVGYYGYPDCIPCDCHINGTEAGICTVAAGSCPCKVNYDGRKCDMCALGYYNFPECKYCACDPAGTEEEICDKALGDCLCKKNYTGERCDRCVAGFYGFPNCRDCMCNKGGSQTPVCNKNSGQCPCRPRVTGKRCDQPIKSHFYPNLHQLKLEIEDGVTPEGYRVRYGYDNYVFPDYSWRGYAILTDVQDYFVLIPQDFYEATVLQQHVNSPCAVPGDEGPTLCRQVFTTEEGLVGVYNISTGYVSLTFTGPPGINIGIREIEIFATIGKPGQYVILFHYYMPTEIGLTLPVTVFVGGQPIKVEARSGW
ncbi:hypothetical protein ACOMHN_011674 [Nucella lapillus]